MGGGRYSITSTAGLDPGQQKKTGEGKVPKGALFGAGRVNRGA